MLRTFKTLLLAGLVVVFAAPAFAGSISPVGQWEVTSGEARYRITACGPTGQELCAKLVWLRADARSDENLALLNTYVVKGAQPVDANSWTGNVVVAGHSYDGTVTLVSSNYLKLRGCSGVLCQTYELTRI